ncbi:MAG: CvpA family protein [Deltaproteobacteria bacterium]
MNPQTLHSAFSWNGNWLDILIGVIIVVAFVRGLWTGFSRSVSTLAGLVAGFWVAMHLFGPLSERLLFILSNEMWARVAAFVLVFLFVYLGFFLVGVVLQGFLRLIRLGWLDRIAGAGVGIAKGLVMVGVLLFVLTLFLPPKSDLLSGSVLYPRLVAVAQGLSALVPVEIRGQFLWRWRNLVPGDRPQQRRDVKVKGRAGA